MINENFNIAENVKNEVGGQILKCKEIINKDFVVVGVGGLESWFTLLSAIDTIGRDKVLAVNIYSVFSDSTLPAKIQSFCQGAAVQYCDVDMTKTIEETLPTRIGLMRVEKEALHYSMTHMHKAELIAGLRQIILRGIADRHNAILLNGISLSKIITGWVSPSYSIYDWNPLYNCTRYQVAMAISALDFGNELIHQASGLDVQPDGGLFPADFDLELMNDEFLTGFSSEASIIPIDKLPNLGLGIYQEKNE